METTESQKSPVVERENPLRQEKRRKLDELKTLGIDPFPHNYERTHLSDVVHNQFDQMDAGDKQESAVVSMAGRLMTRRDMGKASFFNIQDSKGTMQGYVRLEELRS